MPDGHAAEEPDPLDAFRQFFALQGDALVLPLATFAFSLGFQMTGRYLPQYLSVVGAGSVVIGLYGSRRQPHLGGLPLPRRRTLRLHRLPVRAHPVRRRLDARLPRLVRRRRRRRRSPVLRLEATER